MKKPLTVLDTIKIDRDSLQFWQERDKIWKHYYVDTAKDLLYVDEALIEVKNKT